MFVYTILKLVEKNTTTGNNLLYAMTKINFLILNKSHLVV